MFTQELINFARRKERLVMRAEQQREQIAAGVQRLEKPLAFADRAAAAGRYAAAHPVLVAAGAAAAVVMGRGSLLKWAGRGWAAWRAWRSLQRWMQQSNY